MVEDEPDYVLIRSPDVDCDLYISHGITGPGGMQVWVAVRPEKITLSHEAPQQRNNSTRGVVRDIAYIGSHSIYHVELRSGRILIVTMPNLSRDAEGRPTWDEEVHLYWQPNSGVVLTA